MRTAQFEDAILIDENFDEENFSLLECCLSEKEECQIIEIESFIERRV